MSIKEYKRIAAKKLLEILGQEWLYKNKDNICTYYYEEGSIIRVVFCLISSLPSEQETIENTNPEFQPEDSISFDINKTTKECTVYKNLL